MRDDCVTALQLRYPECFEPRFGGHGPVLGGQGLEYVQPGHFWVVDEALGWLTRWVRESVSHRYLGLRYLTLECGDHGLRADYRWQEIEGYQEKIDRTAFEKALNAFLAKAKNLCGECGLEVPPEERRARFGHQTCLLCRKKGHLDGGSDVIRVELQYGCLQGYGRAHA